MLRQMTLGFCRWMWVVSLVAPALASANDVRHAVMRDDHVSASGTHKLFVRSDDTPALERLTALGSIEQTIDYESFRLVLVDEGGFRAIGEPALSRVVLRDDLDLFVLNDWVIDTRVGEPADLPASLRQEAGTFERQLYVVQFVGPTKDAWLERLERRGEARIVGYLPNGAYVVWASRGGWERISSYRTGPRSKVQWAGVVHPAYRISPYLDEAIATLDGAVSVVVQVVEHAGSEETVSRLKGQALAVLGEDVSLLGMRDIRIEVPAAAIPRMASEPDVLWIERMLPKRKLDERQGQIMAGNLDGTGTQPSSPGYLAWLNGRGFTTNFSFTVDVADDGFDRGSTTDMHQDFRDAGGASRVTYVLNYTSDATGDGGAGHGNVNCAIVGGFNDTQGNASFEDSGGYQYGLGIAPYARLGSSKIFSNAGAFTSASYSTLISGAWNNGARISSNSWGLSGAGANEYTTDARLYDILVRDAVSGTSGNQEMVIVFAAGNDGPDAGTIGSPATGKNVLAVGASENFRQTGTDGCGVTNSGANNARDVINFSSRGPCSDGRTKPDIQAPGTHIQGAASRSFTYDGTGVCDRYWPPGQTLYCWSSGTSHSTPAVSGASALVRQHFSNQGWGTPSPAMTKAFLMATTTHMTGVGANDTLPSNSQGYGRVNLTRAFDGTANLRMDQTQVLGATGGTFTVTGSIADSATPFRVMLAWTDAPGTVNGNAWVNNLDLEVTVNGTLFRGNVFSGASSISGGTADTRNNTEAVFLPAGTTGSFSITVRATAINGDGVPGNGDTTDQDFALFVYNGSAAPPTPDFWLSAAPASQTVTQGNSTSYTATVTSQNGFSSATTLSVSGLPSGATANFSPNPVTPPSGSIATSQLTVSTGSATPTGTFTLSITGAGGGRTHGTTVQLVIQSPASVNKVVTATASPRRPIPDGDTTGVTSTLSVSTAMTIKSVSVGVQITHPFIGDLELSLIGPDGTTVRLHDRSGTSMDDIRTTYDIVTRAAQSLAVFNGRSTAGTWRLRARDLSSQDVGTLDSWTLTFNGYFARNPRRSIPDNSSSGATSTMSVSASGIVTSVRVRVDITHSHRGDLEVSLIAPDGTTVLLHNRTGASEHDLSTVYPDLTTPAQSLSALVGKSIAGTWKLRVRDLALLDTGTLNSWELDLRGR